MNYKDWLDKQSQLQGRDVSADEQDYDLEGYFNTLKATPVDGAGHLPDTFKKPNHPTFSDQSEIQCPSYSARWSLRRKRVLTFCSQSTEHAKRSPAVVF